MRETAPTDNPQELNSPSPFDDADVVRLLDKRMPRGSLGGFFVLVGDFFKAYPMFSIAIVVLSIVAGILETVGVAMLFPAFEGIIADETESKSRITAVILEVFDTLGVPPTVPWFLGIASILMVGKAIAAFGAFYTVGWIFTRVTANLRKELPGNSTDLHDDIHIAMAYKIAAGGAKGDSLLEDAGIFCMAILVDENAEEKPMVERGGFSTSFLMKHAHPTMRTEAIGRIRV